MAHEIDQDKFDKLVLASRDAIRTVGRARLQRHNEVEDFTQDVIVRLYANRDQLRGPEYFPQWVRAIARNTAIKWNRKRLPVPVLVRVVERLLNAARLCAGRVRGEAAISGP